MPEYSAQKANDQVDKLWDVILEQRQSISHGLRSANADELEERLVNLERDQARLLETLQQSGFDIPMASSADGELDGSRGIESRTHKGEASRARSPRWQEFGSRSEDEQEAVCSPALNGLSCLHARDRVDRRRDVPLYNSHHHLRPLQLRICPLARLILRHSRIHSRQRRQMVITHSTPLQITSRQTLSRMARSSVYSPLHSHVCSREME